MFAVRWSVVYCVAACCSVFQCVTVRCRALSCVAARSCHIHTDAHGHEMAAVCWRLLQWVATCCSADKEWHRLAAIAVCCIAVHGVEVRYCTDEILQRLAGYVAQCLASICSGLQNVAAFQYSYGLATVRRLLRYLICKRILICKWGILICMRILQKWALSQVKLGKLTSILIVDDPYTSPRIMCIYMCVYTYM